MKMIPGMNGVEIGDEENKKMARTEAILLSMTRQERSSPNLINGRRRMRIANGSGTHVRDVNQLLKQFGQMRKMMRKMKGKNPEKLMRQMGGGQGGGMPGGGLPPGFPGA